MMDLKNKLNVPNLLSAYRLAMFPVVMYFAISGQERIFAILLVINLVTDVLDGLIARAFKLQSSFGAKLDSYADIGVYISAITGVLIFKAEEFAPHLVSFSIFIIFLLVPKVISFYRFREFPSFHLYSSKIGGYMQGFFFMLLFTLGFNVIYYYVMIIWGILSFIEQIVIVFMQSKPLSDVKGLYWVIKNKDELI